jgi:fibronectin-binding autotransporter adhesin
MSLVSRTPRRLRDRNGALTGRMRSSIGPLSRSRMPPAPTGLFELLESRLLLSGTSYVVDSLADTVAADGVLTLREAVQASDSGQAVNEASAGSATEPNSITFDPSLFAAGAGKITLTGGTLEITHGLSIVGPGQDMLNVDAEGNTRVFDVQGSGIAIVLDGMTITSQGDQAGSGIHTADSTITLNNVETRGGLGGWSCVGLEGGSLSASNSTFSYNLGPGITTTNSSMSLSNCDFEYLNSALIIENSTATITGTSLHDNGGAARTS